MNKSPPLNVKSGLINLSHGSGGKAMMQLIDQLFLPAFDNEYLSQKNDYAQIPFDAERIVMTTDAYVISPLFFPGGNIGDLAVNGTVNDLAMSGARPLYLTVSFILEEGFPLAELQKIIHSMANAARVAGVAIVSGDTKVVERGKADGVFISSSGVGTLLNEINIAGNNAKVGDSIIISGTIGDHGIAVMSQRENIKFATNLQSDTAALNDLVKTMVDADVSIHCLRDPTRGGVATTLNELASQSKVGMIIDEASIPINKEVAGACELLGLEPLYVANEGKLIAICPADETEKLLSTMHKHPLGKEAAVIGKVITDEKHFVQLQTQFGGRRIIDCLIGEQLPRIC